MLLSIDFSRSTVYSFINEEMMIYVQKIARKLRERDERQTLHYDRICLIRLN